MHVEDKIGYDYFGARFYDSEYGRWLSADPLADKYPGWSPYTFTLDNPVKFIDVNGKEVYVASDGYINRNIPIKYPNDPRVYLVMNDKQILIGELGGRIDANLIFKNLLNKNIESAQDIWSPFTFKELVNTRGEWDLKNNKNTIYGLANDEKNRGTFFSFGDRAMNPQDIGNFHYGAVGKATGLFPEWLLEQQAGDAQIESGTSKPQWQNGIFTPFIWPYGDDPTDNYYINRGFDYYDASDE